MKGIQPPLDKDSSLYACISRNYSNIRQKRNEVLPEYYKDLPLKFIFNQREKSNILQDVLTILKGEKTNLRPLLASVSKATDSIKKRSISLHIIKQIYLQNITGLRTLKR